MGITKNNSKILMFFVVTLRGLGWNRLVEEMQGMSVASGVGCGGDVDAGGKKR